MAKKIVVAGATGNLGTRVTKALVGHGGNVVGLVRKTTTRDQLDAMERLGATTAVVDTASVAEMTKACEGAACVVSTVQGLRDVIVDMQGRLLDAAVAAGVPRFIPSDFATDFRTIPRAENRNFDLRRDFHERLDGAAIAPTSIYNGAFAEMLLTGLPLLDVTRRTVGYWDDPDWRIDFTAMDDTAAYTAAAALDAATPEALRIAGFRITPRQLAQLATEMLGVDLELVKLGTRAELAAHNRRERAAHPEGEREIYSSWQQSQYMHSMFTSHHDELDNGRYPGVRWTSARDALAPLAARFRGRPAPAELGMH